MFSKILDFVQAVQIAIRPNPNSGVGFHLYRTSPVSPNPIPNPNLNVSIGWARDARNPKAWGSGQIFAMMGA